LRQAPLSKGAPASWESAGARELKIRFQWLLDSPGIGLLTGDAGVGKTAVLQQLCHQLNNQEYQLIYHSETDFGRVDLYRQLALDFGLEPAYRRANVWRSIKAHIQDLSKNQHRLPVWIIDEAQNLPNNFFRDFPSFMNFTFDSEPLMTVWLVGHHSLGQVLKRSVYESLRSRIQVFVHFGPITDSNAFKEMLQAAFTDAGVTSSLISDSGVELIRLASKGRFRHAGQIIATSLQLTYRGNLNHVPDDIIKCAIEELNA